MRALGSVAFAATSFLLISSHAGQATTPAANTPTSPTVAKPAIAPPAAVAAPAPAIAPAAAATDKPDTQTPTAPVAAVEPAAPAKPPAPTLIAKVNLSTQKMLVVVNGKVLHSWKVSSGAPGYPTPVGTFKPDWMSKMWYSKQYDDAPMPHAVFFKDGAAIHGTTSVGRLGTAASHGCVRLAPANAETFYKLVTRHGLPMTRIAVSGRIAGQDDRIAHRDDRRDGRRDGRRETASRAGPSQARSQPVRVASRQPSYQGSSNQTSYPSYQTSYPISSSGGMYYPGDRRPTGYPAGSVQSNRAPYWVR